MSGKGSKVPQQFVFLLFMYSSAKLEQKAKEVNSVNKNFFFIGEQIQ